MADDIEQMLLVAGIKMEYKTIPQGAANMVVTAFDPSITGILSSLSPLSESV
jgi:hypothetical protein